MNIYEKRDKQALDYGTFLHYRLGSGRHVVVWAQGAYGGRADGFSFEPNDLNNIEGDPSPTYALALKSCLEKADAARTRSDS